MIKILNDIKNDVIGKFNVISVEKVANVNWKIFVDAKHETFQFTFKRSRRSKII